jgi:triacylglycerol esterase/lipase EstA (alpha/beta hydrolase family)
MNWFGKHIAVRVVDYGWAYRLRIRMLRGRQHAEALLTGSKRPVLLLPGVYETWHFLGAVGTRLHDLGHPVHVVPAFGRNLRPIADMAELARDYVVASNLTDVVIVAHSKGGLIGKTLMMSDEGARVTRMVAINTPFGGSAYARLVPIRTLREFVPTHDTIVALAGGTDVNARILSIYSAWDPIIPNGSALAGATNLELPENGHFRILDTADLLDVVARSVQAS